MLAASKIYYSNSFWVLGSALSNSCEYTCIISLDLSVIKASLLTILGFGLGNTACSTQSLGSIHIL